MDLWTQEVQEQVLTLVGTLLGIVLAWVGVRAKAYLAALETKTLEAARQAGGEQLEAWAEIAIRWVEQTAGQQAAKLTNTEKLQKAAEFVLSVMPEVEYATAVATIESVLNRLRNGWYAITPTEATCVATTVTEATVADVATRVEAAVVQAEAAAARLQALADGIKGGGAQ